jgi:SET domain
MREHIRPFSFERIHLSDIGSLPSYVRIGKSKIPGAGRGLFATRSLPAGTPLTAYPGPLVDESNVSSRTRSCKKRQRCVEAYIFEIVHLEKVLTLQPHPADIGNGVAHLANDAIHPEVTGFSNNCDFIQKEENSVYLCTSRRVRRGEELFVDYLLPYWTSRKRLPRCISRWVGKVSKIQDALNAMDVRLEQYMGDGEFKIIDPKLRVLCKGCESKEKRRIKCMCRKNTSSISNLTCATCGSHLMYF